MITIDSETTVVEVPEGFRFGGMDVHAESWEAYDRLVESDGLTERSARGVDGRTYRYKTLGPWPGGCIAAHAPSEARS